MSLKASILRVSTHVPETSFTTNVLNLTSERFQVYIVEVFSDDCCAIA